MRLSPRGPYIGIFQIDVGDAEMGLGHFDAAINEYRKAIDLGFHRYGAQDHVAVALAGLRVAARLSRTRRLSVTRWPRRGGRRRLTLRQGRRDGGERGCGDRDRDHRLKMDSTRRARYPAPMCNLYSLTKGQAAIRDLFRARNDRGARIAAAVAR
jgi:hypothetical protein